MTARFSLGGIATLLAALAAAACSSGGGGTSPASTRATATTAPAAHATDDPALVVTTAGPVRGIATEDVRTFLGVPFAAPPVGDLRWRPPRPPRSWTAPRDATRPGPECVQTAPVVNRLEGEEDCLYLNLYAPVRSPRTAPVMVWIHGGGFIVGSANDVDGTEIARRTGTVVVAVSYRLGALGFLAHSALSAESPAWHASGNYGIEDQQAALEWVRDNVAAFGGDPGNVTIFGESAGGMSVCAHLASPRSAGLFHRAIDESGPCTFPYPTLAAAEGQGARLADAAGCGNATDAAACLRAKPARAVHEALPPDLSFLFGRGPDWRPVLDGIVFEQQPSDAFRRGAFNRVPTIMGTNRDEGTLFVGLAFDLPGTPVTAAQYPEILTRFFGDPAIANEVVTEYPLADYPMPGDALAASIGDALLACPTIEAAALLAPHTPTFLYSFEYAGADFVIPFEGLDMGAFHSAEIPFVFATPLGSATLSDFTVAEKALSDSMMGYWTRFAATGDPNGGGAPRWPVLDEADRHLVFDTVLSTAAGLKADRCRFWRDLHWKPAARLTR